MERIEKGGSGLDENSRGWLSATMPFARLSRLPSWALLITLALALLAASSRPSLANEGEVEGKEASAPVLFADLFYREGEADPYVMERCLLDLYVPARAEEGFATLVWFHGGGIQSGDKAGDIAKKVARYFADAGIAVASVNYRLSPKVKYPVYLEDAAKAVGHLAGMISQYGGDPQRLYVSGHSAGGYLAAMVASDPSLAEHLGPDSKVIAGVLPVAGQMITHSTVRKERGIPRSRPIVDEAAPSYHVRKDLPPFLNFVGDNDMPMRSEENRYFIAALRAAGHEAATFIEVPGRDHGSVASKIGDANDPVGPAMVAFMSGVEAKEND